MKRLVANDANEAHHQEILGVVSTATMKAARKSRGTSDDDLKELKLTKRADEAILLAADLAAV